MRNTNSLLAIIVATVSLVFVVQGQGTQSTKSRSTKTKPKPTSQGNTQTRSRRSTEAEPSASPTTPPATVTTTATPNSEKPADSKPAASQVSTTTDPKSTTPAAATASPVPGESLQPSSSPSASPATSAPTPDDPVMTLRDQIETAETPQERAQLQLKLADLYLTTGKKSEALAELHRVATTDAFAPQDIYNAGNSLARLGDMDGAIEAYRKAIEQLNGNYSRAYNNLGVVLLRAGRWQESYEALISALRIENFRYPEASYNLGRLYATRGENDLAVREWRRVLSLNPNHIATREALTRLGKEGTVEVAVSNTKLPSPPKQSRTPSITPAKNEDPKPVNTVKASDKPVSVKSPKTRPTVLTVDPDTYDFLLRARNSNERGKLTDAISNYKKAISSNGGYLPPANLELSYLLITQKQYEEALENLLLVANRDGAQFPISYFHLARLYEARGEFKQAEAAFGQAATAFQPTNNQFLLDVSRVREKQGNYQGALEALEQYVQRMKQQGHTVTWSDERISALRQKLNPPK